MQHARIDARVKGVLFLKKKKDCQALCKTQVLCGVSQLKLATDITSDCA